MHGNNSVDGSPFSPHSYASVLSASSNAVPPPLLQTAYFQSSAGGAPVVVTPHTGSPYYNASPHSAMPLEFSLLRASSDGNSFLGGGTVLQSSTNASSVHRVQGHGSVDPHAARAGMHRSSGSPLSQPYGVHISPITPISEPVPSPPARVGVIPVMVAVPNAAGTASAASPSTGFASGKVDPQMRVFHQEQLRRIRQFQPEESKITAEDTIMRNRPPGEGASGQGVPFLGSTVPAASTLPPLKSGTLPTMNRENFGSAFSSQYPTLYGASGVGSLAGAWGGIFSGNSACVPGVVPAPVSPEAVLAAHQEEMSRIRLEALSGGGGGNGGPSGTGSLQHQLFQQRMDQQEKDWSVIVEQFQKLHDKLDADVEVIDPDDVRRMLDCRDLDEAERQSKRSLETLKSTVEELRTAVRQTNRSKTERKRRQLESEQELRKRQSQMKIKSRLTGQSSASSQQMLLAAMEEEDERRRAFDVESKAREAQITQLKDVMADLRIDLEEAEGKNREMEQEAQHQTEMASRGWEIEIASYRKQITTLAEDLSSARDDLQKVLLEAQRRREDAEEQTQKEMKDAENKIETLKSQLLDQKNTSAIPRQSSTGKGKCSPKRKHRSSLVSGKERLLTRSRSVTSRHPSPLYSGRTAGSAPAFRAPSGAGSPLVPVSTLGKRLLPSLAASPNATTETTAPRYSSGYSGIGGLGGIALGGPGLAGLGFGGGGAGSVHPLPEPTTLTALSSMNSTPRTMIGDLSGHRSGSTAQHQNAGIAEAKHAVDVLRRQVEDAMKSARKETDMQHCVEVSRSNPYPSRTPAQFIPGNQISAGDVSSGTGPSDSNTTSQRILEQLQQLLPSLQRLGDDRSSSGSSEDEEGGVDGFVQEDAGAMAQLLSDLTALRQEVRSYKEENELQFEKAKTAFESAQSKREKKVEELEEATTQDPPSLLKAQASPRPTSPPVLLVSQCADSKERFQFQSREDVIRRVQQNPILNPPS